MNKAQTRRWLRSQRVAVLKGGWSTERSISLKTGASVEKSFKRLNVKFLSVDVKKNFAHTLARHKIQFAFNALHGPFGEDGKIQSVMDLMKIGYTGSDAISSAMAMDKHISKVIFRENNVPTPDWCVVHRSDSLIAAKKLLAQGSVFVKPPDQGSALATTHVTHSRQLQSALTKCFKISSAAMIERRIKGRELTVGILGKRLLPIIEIIPQHSFYDFHSKYAAGGSRHVLPSPLTAEQSKKAREVALNAFNSLFCSVYGRVDIIMSSGGRMNVLEVNTIPGMTDTSLLPEAARHSGIGFDDLVLKIVSLSRGR